MSNLTEHLIKGSNNKITLTLTDDDVAIAAEVERIDITFFSPYGMTPVLAITRSPTGNGVSYDAGVLQIDPDDLTEDLDELVDGRLYRVEITITTAADDGGVEFGGPDSDNRLFFLVSSAAA